MDVMKTLFLNPPSYDDFDGGAGSRYQATREVWSFWYPTWLAYPAGMIPGARLLDAPPHNYTPEQTVAEAKELRLRRDPYLDAVAADGHPYGRGNQGGESRLHDCFRRRPSDGAPEETLKISRGDRYRRAQGIRPLDGRSGAGDGLVAKSAGSAIAATGSSATIPTGRCMTDEELDQLPFVTEVYERNLDYLRYNSPYCQYPYVSMYTGRGCPARCTFCLWPQVTQGHKYRVRSPENVYEEVAAMKAKFPKMKELFFDDDTFTADPMRARKIAQLLKPLGITWSTNSRANVDYETLKILKDGGLRLFVVGYESGNAKILKNIKKGVRLDRARRFTRDCHELGILIHGTFILGLPGETQGDDRRVDAVRARDGLRDDPGFARVALSRHRTVRVRHRTTATWRSIRCSTNRVTRNARVQVSGTERRRDLSVGRALLPQFLFPPALHLQIGAQDG